MTMESPIGTLTILAKDGFVTEILFANHESTQVSYDPVVTLAKRQLKEYFSGKRKVFDVPIKPEGGAFHKKVWLYMAKNLKYGDTICYSNLARLCGNEKAARAVGMANNRNPIPIIIPCHRVVGKNGKMTGFRWGIGVKEKLLALEKEL